MRKVNKLRLLLILGVCASAVDAKAKEFVTYESPAANFTAAGILTSYDPALRDAELEYDLIDVQPAPDLLFRNGFEERLWSVRLKDAHDPTHVVQFVSYCNVEEFIDVGVVRGLTFACDK